MTMRKMGIITQAAAVAAMLAFTAANASAQACAGYPAAQGQFSLGGHWSNSVGLLDGGNTGTALGVEGSLNRLGNAAVFARLNLITPDDDDRHAAFGLGAAYEIGGFIPAVPTWLRICPVASVTFSQVDGNARFGVPLGLGFGMELPVENFALLPYAVPTFRLVNLGLDDIGWEHNFGIGLGVLARLANLLYVGVEFDRNFVDDANFDFAIRGGVLFPR
jgi:hypothetical protein